MKQHTWTEIEPKAPPLKVQLWEIALDRAVKMSNEKQRLKQFYVVLPLVQTEWP